jgi:hypothetical protein
MTSMLFQRYLRPFAVAILSTNMCVLMAACGRGGDSQSSEASESAKASTETGTNRSAQAGTNRTSTPNGGAYRPTAEQALQHEAWDLARKEHDKYWGKCGKDVASVVSHSAGGQAAYVQVKDANTFGASPDVDDLSSADKLNGLEYSCSVAFTGIAWRQYPAHPAFPEETRKWAEWHSSESKFKEVGWKTHVLADGSVGSVRPYFVVKVQKKSGKWITDVGKNLVGETIGSGNGPAPCKCEDLPK